MPSPIPVAVLGATGYAGELAVKILLGHPGFALVHAGSDRLHGTRLADAVPAFSGETEMMLAPDTPAALRASGARAVVLAKKSPDVTRVVPELLAAGMRLVDIGAEFRLRDHAAYRKWHGKDGEEHACPELLSEATYGLSEINTDAIRRARVVGNPGCYATSVLLPLIPLVRARLLDVNAPIVAVCYSGLSGAGKKYSESTSNLFWAMNENLRSYKQVGHQHVAEIDQELAAAAGAGLHCTFVPHLAPITRGIHSTITATLAPGVDAAAVLAQWRTTYAGRPFVRVRAQAKDVEVANVTGNNFVDISAAADGRTLIIVSVLDNLVKGASGQAIQNLNLMFGLDESAGLLHRGL
ncbi:MAG: N-acetyl-gamma-glutamyl-phosphate reductase [Planctomycetes bacterium]|nr:N-acetyl-gamma-glutamyl-phosphate reductase [Planctomycetota bacterium]